MFQNNLAQYNVARLKAEPEDLPDFLAEVERVNALSDEAPGFIWRYVAPGDGHSLSHRVQDNLVVNLTVWSSVDALWEFTYKADHLELLRRRREWFHHTPNANVLWFVPLGHRPTVEEAEERLAHLRLHGPTRYAFTFKQRFDAETTEEEATLLQAVQASQDGAGPGDETA